MGQSVEEAILRGSPEGLFTEAVQKGCSQRQSRKAVHRGSPERQFTEAVQKGCSQRQPPEAVLRGSPTHLQDQAGHRAHIGATMATDLSLGMHTAE